jgi:hypothetical protein
MSEPAALHPSKMQSFRLEEDHIATIDKLARVQGLSRSQWFRRAILAQLVADLVDLREDEVPCETPEIPLEELGDRPPLTTEELGEQFAAVGQELLDAIAAEDPLPTPDEVEVPGIGVVETLVHAEAYEIINMSDEDLRSNKWS